MRRTTENQPAPAPGNILWCRFPEVEGLRKPGPKSRPALVIAVWDERSPPSVKVAYGTSRDVLGQRPWEIAISLDDPEAFRISGLRYPTKFSLRNTVDLPYTAEWFTAAPGRNSPKLGILHPSLVASAQAAYEAAIKRR